MVGMVLCVEGDNPMQSEFASHIGTQGKKPCRMCEVSEFDGTEESLRALIMVRSGNILC